MIGVSRADILFNKTLMKNPSDKKSSISDEQLFLLCKRFGSQALLARRKFIGLLPAIFRRQIYLKKKFSSIYEFAAKLGGVSKEQVDTVLRLDRKFEEMPILKNALTEGEISISKISRIASIATKENQSELTEKAKILPKSALEVFVKDVKTENTQSQNSQNQNGLFEPKTVSNSLPGQTFLDENFSPELKQKLYQLHQKGIDINELLLEFLKKREEEIEQEKAKITEKQNENEPKSTGVSNKLINKPISRYVPIQIKRILNKEHGTICSVPHCQKPAKTIHHTLPFSLAHSHDPRFLAPLCESHHKIAHLANVKFAEINRR